MSEFPMLRTWISPQTHDTVILTTEDGKETTWYEPKRPYRPAEHNNHFGKKPSAYKAKKAATQKAQQTKKLLTEITTLLRLLVTRRFCHCRNADCATCAEAKAVTSMIEKLQAANYE